MSLQILKRFHRISAAGAAGAGRSVRVCVCARTGTRTGPASGRPQERRPVARPHPGPPRSDAVETRLTRRRGTCRDAGASAASAQSPITCTGRSPTYRGLRGRRRRRRRRVAGRLLVRARTAARLEMIPIRLCGVGRRHALTQVPVVCLWVRGVRDTLAPSMMILNSLPRPLAHFAILDANHRLGARSNSGATATVGLI